MTTPPALVLTSLDDTIAFLEQELAKLEGEIDVLINMENFPGIRGNQH